MSARDKLLSCPFCGGEAELLIDGRTGNYSFLHEGKAGCPAAYAHFGSYGTEAEAIKAWNKRAETVFVTGITTVTDTQQITYVPERTCYDYNASAREHGAYLFMWRCSNCGESYDTEMDNPNYCPNCGAKVVE